MEEAEAAEEVLPAEDAGFLAEEVFPAAVIFAEDVLPPVLAAVFAEEVLEEPFAVAPFESDPFVAAPSESVSSAAVTVTLDPNETGETRSAKITIKAGGIEKQITVSQAPEEVVPENIVINYIWNSQDDTKITPTLFSGRF